MNINEYRNFMLDYLDRSIAESAAGMKQAKECKCIEADKYFDGRKDAFEAVRNLILDIYIQS